MSSGCSKDDKFNFDINDLYGTWIFNKTNGEFVETDDIFVCQFLSNGYEYYGNKVDSEWTFDATTMYHTEGNYLLLEREGLYLKCLVTTLTDNVFIYDNCAYIVNGVDKHDTNTYQAYKSSVDYSASILGMWEGSCVTLGQDQSVKRWEYKSDGSYNYYTKKSNGDWENKADNQGKYYVYGELLVTTWVNDLLTGTQGPMCELWICSINGNNMHWSGLRSSGQTIEYEMTKQL